MCLREGWAGASGDGAATWTMSPVVGVAHRLARHDRRHTSARVSYACWRDVNRLRANYKETEKNQYDQPTQHTTHDARHAMG